MERVLESEQARLLIVDDEWEAADYFERILLQEDSLQLDIYKAHSGKEALACLEKLRMDIVLSDIRMPGMDGLQMYDTIKERWAQCRVIFISGIMEFDYVYSSFQKKDVRYLTKLEPKEKIIGTVKEVLKEIEENYNLAREKQLFEKQRSEALPLLRNKFLAGLLEGAGGQAEEADLRMKELGIPLVTEKGSILVGAVFDGQAEVAGPERKDQDRAAADLLFGQLFQGSYRIASYLDDQNLLLWLLQEREEEEGRKASAEAMLNGKLEYLQKQVRFTLDTTITLTFYKEPVGWEEIPKVYSYLKRTLGYKASLLTEGIIICSGYETQDIWQVDKGEIDSRKQLVHINELEGYLELGKSEAYTELLIRMTACLEDVKSFHYGPALEVYYRIMGVILKYINGWKLTEKLVFKTDLYKLYHPELHASWKDAAMYLKYLSDCIFEIHFSDEKAWSLSAVTRVRNYIEGNLEKDLSLIRLADEVQLNASYLSRLFKNVTGSNIYEYILDCRMRRARELLLKSGGKIQDIGCSVGYDSAQSFTRAFRKYTGQTPTDYREKEKKC